METPDPHKNWLEEYNREVEEVMAEQQTASIGTGRSASERAVSEFENWWLSETQDLAEDSEPAFVSEQINKELELSRKEIRILQTELGNLRKTPEGAAGKAVEEQIQKLAEERANLQVRIQQLEADNKELRGHEGSVQRDISELRIKMSRAQDDYEGQIRRFEDKSQALKEQIRVMNESKEFLQREYSRQSTRLEAFEDELKGAYEEKNRIDAVRKELEEKVRKMEKSLADGSSQKTSLEGSIKELRLQAWELQERLLSGGRGESDPAAKKKQLEEDTAGESKELANRLSEQQKKSEEKLGDTVRYLETKLREIQGENRDRLGEVRDLLHSLSRFHKG